MSDPVNERLMGVLLEWWTEEFAPFASNDGEQMRPEQAMHDITDMLRTLGAAGFVITDARGALRSLGDRFPSLLEIRIPVQVPPSEWLRMGPS